MAGELKAYRGWAWVSRDGEMFHSCGRVSIWAGEGKPDYDLSTNWWVPNNYSGVAGVINADGFAHVFGVHIEPGECVRVWFGAVL